MQQQVKETPIDAETAQPQRSQAAEAAHQKRKAAALWRAVAGMAISLALACLIVMLEFTSHAAYRADRMHRHAAALRSKVSRLESEVATARARIVTARRELAGPAALRALLRAPDAGMLMLSPPASPVAAGVHNAAPAQRPKATLALGPSEHRAVLMVTGLKPTADDMLFVLWLNASHGTPVRAADFRTAADGSALVTLALPPGLEVTAAMVTTERAAKDASNVTPGLPRSAPPGPVQLRGSLVR
ncbi:MAG: hypothetical protein ACREPW_11920 [Candidatus Binataceae bacterium]